METRDAARHGEAGFSIIEGLIAAALLLIITVGVLPLFSRSMLNNVRGNDSSRQSNCAVDELERTSALPFNSGAMIVDPAGTSTVTTSVIGVKHLPSGDIISTKWEPAASVPAADQIALRTRTLQQFSFDDFRDDQSFDDPLPGDAEARLVHIKVVDLRFDDAISNPLLANAPRYQLRMLSAY